MAIVSDRKMCFERLLSDLKAKAEVYMVIWRLISITRVLFNPYLRDRKNELYERRNNV